MGHNENCSINKSFWESGTKKKNTENTEWNRRHRKKKYLFDKETQNKVKKRGKMRTTP